MAAKYTLKLGDCIFCVINEHGFTPVTVWNHPQNDSLKEKRQTLKNLVLGDVIFIPDIRPKEVKEPTNEVHKFYLKGEPHRHWIEIELVGEDNKPIPREKYSVILPDGKVIEGELDEQGWARLESVLTGDCQVTFPELDKKVWEHIETSGPKPASQ
jgi:hypothetical protein